MLQYFTKKITNTRKKTLGQKKSLKEKVTNYILNRKTTIIHLRVGLIKKIAQMGEHFPKPKPFRVNVKVELDLSNYGTKHDLKNATGADTSYFC